MRNGHTLERVGLPCLVASCTLLSKGPPYGMISRCPTECFWERHTSARRNTDFGIYSVMAFCYLCSENIMALATPAPTPMAQAMTPCITTEAPCCCSQKIPSIVRKCHIAWGTGFPTPALSSAMHQQRSNSLYR